MAAVLVVLLSWGSVASGFAQEATGRPFITKWQGKADEELKIPIVGTDYKLVIKDEQGKVVMSKEKVTVTGKGEDYYPAYYPAFTPTADGVYTVEARPAGVRYMQIGGNPGGPLTRSDRLLEVVQFGTVAWEKMNSMFELCRNMRFATNIDTPDLTKVTNMGWMFYGCSSFNQPLGEWDVSKVTNMGYMFAGCSSFNQPLEEWDVSKVTDMMEMFADCTAFNQPLGEWNVSKVTNMYRIFAGCKAFNQPLEKWDVSKVTHMSGMFWGCHSFNQPLGEWDVSKVTDMSEMFAGCKEFNQPLGEWNVSKVTRMSGMFWGCHSFNQPLEKWDVSNVFDMGSKSSEFYGMFTYCYSFNQPLGGWAPLLTAIGGLSTTNMSVVNYSLSLIGWTKRRYVDHGINFGSNVEGLIYNDAGKEARKKLIDLGWEFYGDIYRPSEKVAISLAKEGEGTLAIEDYNDASLQAVAECTELTVTVTPKEGYTLTSLTAGTQDILATKKFTVTGAMTVKAVFKKKGNNGGGNNGGGNGGGTWQPQTPQAVEDVVLASLVVAPNPFTSQLRIDNPEGVAGRYELVNASGVVVRFGAFSATEVLVDTEALPAGLYLVRITAQNGAKRMVKVSKY